MAERPVFIPMTEGPLVKEMSFSFQWHSGFAPVQKKKNIVGLHEAAQRRGLWPLLELSTKSDAPLGRHLSAFNLRVRHPELGEIALECAFQGSKVFEHGGPYTDLYEADSRAAKKDPRLRSSGRVIAFRFGGRPFPTEPKTAFYDWLYITALYPHREWLRETAHIEHFAGFTDIEFNPEKSINCQARSCAALVAMMKRDVLSWAVESPEHFIEVLSPAPVPPTTRSRLF